MHEQTCLSGEVLNGSCMQTKEKRIYGEITSQSISACNIHLSAAAIAAAIAVAAIGSGSYRWQ